MTFAAKNKNTIMHLVDAIRNFEGQCDEDSVCSHIIQKGLIKLTSTAAISERDASGIARSPRRPGKIDVDPRIPDRGAPGLA
jgi:hypothetical protein